MNDVLMVELPLSRDAAFARNDKQRRAAVGKLVGNLLRPSPPGDDPLARLVAEVKEDARAGGFTDAEVDAGSAACNAENRV